MTFENRPCRPDPASGDAFEDDVTSEKGFASFETGLVHCASPLEEKATWKLPPDSGVLASSSF